jgi:iron complex transport system substrate-binding protein
LPTGWLRDDGVFWRRVIGVTDLCSYPPAARERPQVSHTTIDTSTMSMEEVETQMQRCKAEGRSPFTVDGEFLARHQPGIVLTQDTCQSCDPTTSQVLQVCTPHGIVV